MTHLIVGVALFVLGAIALQLARPRRGATPKVLTTDDKATFAALIVTSMLSLGLGLVVTGLYEVSLL